MRERIRKELLSPESGFFDLKQDVGGIVDIEFLVQYLVLLNSWKYRELLKWTDIVWLLETLNETGIINGYIAHILKVGYLTYRATVHQHNLQEKPAKVSENRFCGLRKNVKDIWKNIMKAV